jgi:hypothetical protein
LFLLVGTGGDGVAVQQYFVARQIVFESADLVFDIQQIVFVFEAILFEGELLGRDLKLQRRIGKDDQRLASRRLPPAPALPCRPGRSSGNQ